MTTSGPALSDQQSLHRNDPRGLTHALAASLKSLIAAGRLSTGDRLPSESELCRSFDVSRTVVREAISQLRAEGLIETFHGKGSFIALPQAPTEHASSQSVVDLSLSQSPRDVMELRMAVETEAAALAAVRHTDQDIRSMDAALSDLRHATEVGGSIIGPDWAVHMAVATASANPLLIATMRAMGPSAVLRHRASLDDDVDVLDPEHSALILHEHHVIRDAVARGDAEAARAAIRVHLSRSMAALRR